MGLSNLTFAASPVWAPSLEAGMVLFVAKEMMAEHRPVRLLYRKGWLQALCADGKWEYAVHWDTDPFTNERIERTAWEAELKRRKANRPRWGGLELK
jgi:hypothetical protein